MELYHVVRRVEGNSSLGEWDDLTKMLVRAHPQDLVSLVLPNTRYLEDVTTELRVHSIAADFLCKAERNGEKFIVHVEFQKGKHARMGRRTWEYNCATTLVEEGLAVYSFVIYLVKTPTIDAPPFRIALKGGEEIHTFHYKNIFLWEMPPEVLMQKGMEGMLPLLPLTKGAQRTRDKTVDDMIGGLRAAGKEDVLALGEAFAGLVYPTKDDERAIKRRFAVFQEALENSWFYKEVIEQGMQKGLEQGMQKGLEQGLEQGKQQGLEQGEMKALRAMLIRVVKMHFPDQVSLAQEVAERSTIPEALNAKIDKLLLAKTTEEARQALQEVE